MKIKKLSTTLPITHFLNHRQFLRDGTPVRSLFSRKSIPMWMKATLPKVNSEKGTQVNLRVYTGVHIYLSTINHAKNIIRKNLGLPRCRRTTGFAGNSLY